jgi:hypothetical protein
VRKIKKRSKTYWNKSTAYQESQMFCFVKKKKQYYVYNIVLKCTFLIEILLPEGRVDININARFLQINVSNKKSYLEINFKMDKSFIVDWILD